MKKSTIPFDKLLDDYIEHFDRLCCTLMDICKTKKHGPQQYIWMGPYSTKDNLTDQQQKQFANIVRRTRLITKSFGFHLFNRHSFLKTIRKEFLVSNSYYLSPQGIVNQINI